MPIPHALDSIQSLFPKALHIANVLPNPHPPKKIKKKCTATLNKHIAHGWKRTDLMPNGQIMRRGGFKIHKKNQTLSSFDYAANSSH